ncbi:MAG: TonB-dependent receptor, partial [Bacteroidia bacterium]|nr:TonB-dependent receptor [Bacteroidia bacterium]MDW8333433.1 TonB-dependent receptor [Bacteroidia bacterium]
MILRALALTACFWATAPWAYGQVGGTLRGRVTYGDEPAELATVKLMREGGVVRGTYTDSKGSYEFVNVPPGTYDIEVTYVGEKKEIRGLKVSSGLETPVPVINLSEDVQVATVEIQEAIVKADNTTRKVDYDRSSILKVTDRSIAGVAALGAGVYVPDAGRSANFRGGRADQSQTFIDGIRIIGNSTMPQIAYDNVAVITGAVPPWYGDFLSGIIDITTADPTVEHKFNFEAVTSQFLDPYGYNLVAGGAGGPIFSRRDSASGYKKTKLGYFAAFETEHVKDPSPSILGVYRVKDEVLKDLENDPLTLNPQGNAFINRATLLTRESWEKKKYRDNAAQRHWTFFGKLMYNLNDNSTLRAGVSFRNFRGNGWSVSNNFLSPRANRFDETNNLRAFVRFNQIFTPDSAEKSTLKSLYYFVQADYSLVQGRTYNRDHRDNVFRYGHIGRFTTATAESFRLVSPGEPGHDPALSPNPYYVTAAAQPTDTAYYFDPSTSSNPSMAAYNNSIYRVMGNVVRVNPLVLATVRDINDLFRTGVFNFLDLFLLNGLPNGFTPRGVYSLWTAQGTPYLGYGKSQSDMIRFTGQATMELGKKGVAGIEAKKRGGLHSLRFGFEFDQRFERFYGLNAVGLWQLMRLQANKHLTNIDSSTAAPVFRDGYFQDTVRYSPLYDASSQSEFDKNLRRKLGLDIADTRFINTDALDPSFYSLDMFTANELLNNGNYYVSYLGYDHLGNIARRSPAEKFFTDERNRPQNAFAPTYVSGYIQDKFELDKLYLSLGVRVDRLDLNQPVPKDKYSLYPTYNAREAAQILGVKKPENIGDDWVAYASY